MEGWAFLFFVVTIWSVIGSIQHRVRGKGHGWAVQFIAAWPLGFLAGFLVFGLFIDESVVVRLLGVALGVAALFNLMTRWSDLFFSDNKPPPIPPRQPRPNTAQATGPLHLPVSIDRASVVDSEAIEATRQASLAAIKQATEARKLDIMKRGEQPAKPTLPPRTEIQTNPPRQHRPAKSMHQAKGLRLDVIQFDYVDAMGEASSRRVVVQTLEATYFNGGDTDLGEIRTFRIDRVQGRILSETTGELMEPAEWANSLAREHAIHRIQPLDAEPDLQRLEICFTGFKQSRRIELERLAEKCNFKVVKSVTVGLDYLVTGPNAGPTKIEHARSIPATILGENEFLERFSY